MLTAFEGLLDLPVVGMALRGLLGEHQVAVDHHLEDPAAGGDQGQLGNAAGVVRQELGRQTDGPVRIVSDHAVFDADLHGSPFRACQSRWASSGCSFHGTDRAWSFRDPCSRRIIFA